MPSIVGYGTLIICLVILPLIMSGPYYIHTFILTMINIALASSVRLISLTGQLSLAHGGMATIGAYVSALLMMKLGLSSWLALLIAGLSGVLVASLVGYPFVRLKGVYFTIVTAFFGEMVVLTAQQWNSLTGGSGGVYGIPAPDPIVIPGLLNIDFSSKLHFYYFALIIMIIALIILYAIEKSRVGLTFRGIKQADSLAEASGIDTTGYKVFAFATGSFFAGIIGGFYSQYISAIAPDTFGFMFTIYVLVYMTVGGQQTFTGPILGSFVLTLLPEATRVFKEYVPFFFAAVLIAVIFFVPEGLAGLVEKVTRRVSKKFGVNNA
jgi:branched-chain amino acid transport system permease protein